MRRLLALAILTTAAVTLRAEDRSLVPAPEYSIATLVENEASRPAELREMEERSRAMRTWAISVIPVVASQILDTTSSYGMRELNPLLASSDGRFGAKAAGIKFGATAALLGVEYLIARKHPGAARLFSKLNWSGAALTSAVAVRNYSIR